MRADSTRGLVRSLSLLVALALVHVGCSADGPTTKGRNIVVIVMDTTRFDRLGFNGYAAAETPFLDELASQGVVFDAAMSASSWTAPATASIFTSLYPDQHGVTSGYFFYQRVNATNPEIKLNRLPAKAQTLPELLKATGYRTFGLADNLNIGERMGFTRGFDRFDTWAYKGGAHVNLALGEWRDAIQAGDAPFFLYLQYMDPHKPYHVHDLDPEMAKAPLRYNAELKYLDGLLAEMFAELELDRNTLVVITADHGEEFGDHGSEGHDRGLYQELVHVPLVVVGRDADGALDFEPGRVAARVSTLDILPTIAEFLYRPAPPHIDGESLMPFLRDPAQRSNGLGERAVFAQRMSEGIDADRTFNSITRGAYQLIQQPAKQRYQLFDLSKDPLAQHDLFKANPQLARELAEELAAFLEREIRFERNLAGDVTLDAETQADLGRLGYAE